MDGLLQGMAIGLTAGIVPGPLLALFLAHSARFGWRRTLPAVLAPLASDGPIILLVVFLLSSIPAAFLLALRFVGGVYLVTLAVRTYRQRHETVEAQPGRASQAGLFRSAVAINLLNPNPYLFWGVALGPVLIAEYRVDPLSAAAFVAGFYAVMLSIFAAWVLLFGKSADLPPRLRRTVQVLASLVMAGFGIYQVVIALGQTRI